MKTKEKKEETDEDIFALSEQSLRLRLKEYEKSGKPPKGSFLCRAMQMDSEELYKKCLSLGASLFYTDPRPRFSYASTSPSWVQKVAFLEPEGKWFTWGLDVAPSAFLYFLCQGDVGMSTVKSRIPWKKIAKHPNISGKASELACVFLRECADHEAIEAILERSGGDLKYPSVFGGGGFYSDRDALMADRIDRIKLGSLKSVNFENILNLGLFRSCVSAFRHIEMLGEVEKIKLSHFCSWTDLGQMYRQAILLAPSEQKEFFNFLCHKIKLTTVDKTKHTAFLLLNSLKNNEASLLCEEIIKAKPILMFQKNTNGQSPLDYVTGLPRDIIKSHMDKISLDKTIKNQTRFGKNRPKDISPPPPVKKRRM